MLYIDWQPSMEAIKIGSFSILWYSLCWVIGLIGGYFIVRKLYADQRIDPELKNGRLVASHRFDPLFLYCFIGVVLGARIGHCVFYEPDYYLTSWKGIVEMLLPVRIDNAGGWHMEGYRGLASHGGAIGLFIALMLYKWRKQMPAFIILDNLGIAAPFCAACIRIGNLMNSEIIGTQTDVPWAFIFHTHESMVNGQTVPRHPSQLYEAIAYIIIFIIILLIYRKSRKAYLGKENQLYQVRERISVGSGFYFGLCIAAIFTFRFCIEFLKKEQGGIDDGSLPIDMGQILSIPFVITGVWAMTRKNYLSEKRKVNSVKLE
jgi:prolipoprotein diacylglyceryl transferase